MVGKKLICSGIETIAVWMDIYDTSFDVQLIAGDAISRPCGIILSGPGCWVGPFGNLTNV